MFHYRCRYLVTQAQQQQDSLAILQQQEQFPNQIEEFKPITLDNLEDLPVMPVDQNMANEIYRVAEEAKTRLKTSRMVRKTTRNGGE